MNIFLWIFIFLESILLIVVFVSREKKFARLTIWILIVFSAYLLLNNFDKNIFKFSDLETIKTKERQEYYANELGKIYRNRLGILYFNNLRLYQSKLEANFFSNLDFNLYFSSSNAKYPLLLGPFFIIGFLHLLIKIPKIPIIYLGSALLLSAFIRVGAGPILLFPIINLCIAIGGLKLFNFLKLRLK